MENDQIKELIQDLIYNKKYENEDIKKIILSLYLTTIKLDKIKKNIYSNSNKLNDLSNKLYSSNIYNNFQDIENNIYLYKGKYLTDIEKIELELVYYASSSNQDISIEAKKLLNELKNLYNNMELTFNDLNKFKQKIVVMQILTNHEITFFDAAYKLLEYYVDKLTYDNDKKI